MSEPLNHKMKQAARLARLQAEMTVKANPHVSFDKTYKMHLRSEERRAKEQFISEMKAQNTYRPKTYTVKEGESFWSIESKLKIPHGSLAKWNPGVNATRIPVKKVINVSPPRQASVVSETIELPNNFLNIDSSETATMIDSPWISIPRLPEGVDYNANPGEKKISLASLGLALTGGGSEYYLRVKDYEKFKRVVQSGKFIANCGGQEKAYKIRYYGGRWHAVDFIRSQKAAFQKSVKVLGNVNIIGRRVVPGAGVLLSYSNMKSGSISTEKFTIDVIMTGVGFIPGIGTVVSTIYFVVDATIG